MGSRPSAAVPRSIRNAKRDSGAEGDPYLSWVPHKEGAVCRKCRSFYHNKHWVLGDDEGRYRKIFGKRPTTANRTVCPACRKIADHYAMGIVRLQGDYLASHKEDILHLIRNEEARARSFNPLERIEAIREQDGRLEVETTNEKLAQRIGKSLRRAHRGVVQYKWSRDNKFIRVEWERFLPPKRPG